ncbi:MAG TPA: tetratricopeptide repeat protein, partial [Candidatus Obscuribacterales bacterium]|nr:tetratricopeptide repeat protein [Candidatus Obscuribacterales bacterium]
QPHCAEFYIGRGLAEIGRRNFQSSLKDFTRANELGHGDTSALSLRADLYETLNKWDESLKDLNSCIKANPKDSTLFIRRGIVLRHLNQLSDAHRDFDKAIAIYPSNGTYEMRGEFHLHAKDYKSAIADFSTALRFLPQSKKALRGLSSAYEGLGRKDLAAEARNNATGDMERVIDQYSRAADGFSRLKHSLGK